MDAVLFDLDGTLIDRTGERRHWPDSTEPHLHNVYIHLRRTRPKLTRPSFNAAVAAVRDEMWADPVHAPTLAGLLRQAIERLGIDTRTVDIDELLGVYAWRPVDGVRPSEGAAATLRMLRRYGVRLGVVTNSSEPMWMRDIELAAYRLLEYLPEGRVASSDVGFLKPHPAIFTAALRQLHARADHSVFVGDDVQLDIVGAQSVGMRAVLLDSDGGKTKLDAIKPDATIQRITELPSWLDQWFPGWRP